METIERMAALCMKDSDEEEEGDGDEELEDEDDLMVRRGWSPWRGALVPAPLPPGHRHVPKKDFSVPDRC